MAAAAAETAAAAEAAEAAAESVARSEERTRMETHYQLPKCSNCNKPATHAPDDCFGLAKNKEKRKAAGFENGKFTNKKEE